MTFRRFAGTKIALAIAFTLAVVVSRPGGRAEPPIDPKEIKVTVKDNELFLQGAKLVFPGDMEQIVKVLGKPSRVVDDVFRYQVWDDFGIAAKQNTFRKNKTTVGLQLAIKVTKEKISPKKAFAGKLTVEGAAIDADTNMAALGKPFEQLADFAIWEYPNKKASVLFQTGDKKGQGVQIFLYECGRER